jgi:hypothetical protein
LLAIKSNKKDSNNKDSRNDFSNISSILNEKISQIYGYKYNFYRGSIR